MFLRSVGGYGRGWRGGGVETGRRDAVRRATGGRTDTRLPAVRQGGRVRVRTVRSYLAGQFAGAQAVLHGQGLGHVGHRLVELLQVALVLHLHIGKGADKELPHAFISELSIFFFFFFLKSNWRTRTSLANVLASFNVL